MEEQRTHRQQRTIDVPGRAFSDRLNQLSAAQSPSGSVYSRLALIHQVAKAYARDAIEAAGYVPGEIEIDEITDPPLYDHLAEDDLVIIHFSY